MNSPKEEKCKTSPLCSHNTNGRDMDKPCSVSLSSPSWEEEFREYFDKTLHSKKPTIKNLDRELCIDFIKELLRSAREEAYHQGCHESDTKVTEQFNRGLKDENSELVKIIREAGRSQALSEVKEILTKSINSCEKYENDLITIHKAKEIILSSLQALKEKK